MYSSSIGPLAASVTILLVGGLNGVNVQMLILLAAHRVFQDYVLSPHLTASGVELHPCC